MSHTLKTHMCASSNLKKLWHAAAPHEHLKPTSPGRHRGTGCLRKRGSRSCSSCSGACYSARRAGVGATAWGEGERSLLCSVLTPWWRARWREHAFVCTASYMVFPSHCPVFSAHPCCCCCACPKAHAKPLPVCTHDTSLCMHTRHNTHSVEDGPADGTVGVLGGLGHVLVHQAAT